MLVYQTYERQLKAKVVECRTTPEEKRPLVRKPQWPNQSTSSDMKQHQTTTCTVLQRTHRLQEMKGNQGITTCKVLKFGTAKAKHTYCVQTPQPSTTSVLQQFSAVHGVVKVVYLGGPWCLTAPREPKVSLVQLAISGHLLRRGQTMADHERNPSLHQWCLQDV